MIKTPPKLPYSALMALPREVYDYLGELGKWTDDVYNTLKNLDIGAVKIATGEAAPTGGEDGDLYIRVAGASTKLYLNINGTFSGFNNP